MISGEPKALQEANATVVNRNSFLMDLDITTFNPVDLIRAYKFKGLNLALNCTHFNGFTCGLLLVPSLGHTCLRGLV